MPQHPSDPLDLLLSRLEGVKKYGDRYMAFCSGHPDKNQSLSLSRGEDGRALVHCYAGCQTHDVLAAVSLELRHLFPGNLSDAQRQQYRRIALEKERHFERLVIEIAKGEATSGDLSGESIVRLALAQERIDHLDQQLAELGGASTPPHRILAAVDLADLMRAELVPVQFVFEPLFPRRHVTLLGGHGGTGKSSLAVALCAHAACGRPWGGFQVERCQAVFVSLEDEGALVRHRLRRVVTAYSLDATAVAQGVRLLDGTEAFAALMTESGDFPSRAIPTPALTELCQQVEGADLIIIDNASDAFDANENSRRDVRAFIRELAMIAKKNDAAVVLLAHIDKAAAKGGAYGNSYSGSTAWHNSVRSRLAMTVDQSGAITLAQEKLNLGRKADPVTLAFNAEGVLMPVDATSESCAPELLAAFDARNALSVVRAAIEAGITVPAAMVGPMTAWHALEPLPELAAMYRTKNGKNRFKAALVHLLREGRLIREGYIKPNRHSGERLVLAQELAQTKAASAPENALECASNISPIPPSETSARLGACAGMRQ